MLSDSSNLGGGAGDDALSGRREWFKHLKLSRGVDGCLGADTLSDKKKTE